MDSIVVWLENHTLSCPYKTFFGIPCPGCGMQRSLIALLRGNVIESLEHYPPLIPILMLFGFICLHLIFKFERGAQIIKIFYIFIVGLIVLNYLINVLL